MNNFNELDDQGINNQSLTQHQLVSVNNKNKPLKTFKREESIFSAYSRNYLRENKSNEIMNNSQNNSNIHININNPNNGTKFSSSKNHNRHSFFCPENNDISHGGSISAIATKAIGLSIKHKASFHKRHQAANKHKRLPFKLKEDLNPIFLIDSLKKSEEKTIQGNLTKKINYYDKIIGFFAVINIIISFLDIHMTVSASSDLLNKSESVLLPAKERLMLLKTRCIPLSENILKILNMIIAIGICTCIIFKSALYYSFLKGDKQIDRKDIIFSRKYMLFFIRDFIIGIIIYPPWVNEVYLITKEKYMYCINVFFFIHILNLSKFYFIGRLLFIYSTWNNHIAKAICLSYDVKPGILFAVKSLVKSRPIISFLCFILLSILITESVVQALEYSVIDLTLTPIELSYSQLVFIHNVLWYVTCRSLTITYGDFNINTYEGQIVIPLLSSFTWLVFCYVIIKMTSILDLTPDEKKAYLKLKKIIKPENQESKAANVIIELLKVKKAKIELNLSINEDLDQNEKTNSIMKLFTLIMMLIKDSKNLMDDKKISRTLAVPVDDLLKSFEKKQIENLKIFNNVIDKSSLIHDELEAMATEQEEIQTDLTELKDLQNKLASYLISNNNTIFNENERKKKIVRSSNNFTTFNNNNNNNNNKQRKTIIIRKGIKLTLSPKKKPRSPPIKMHNNEISTTIFKLNPSNQHTFGPILDAIIDD